MKRAYAFLALLISACGSTVEPTQPDPPVTELGQDCTMSQDCPELISIEPTAACAGPLASNPDREGPICTFRCTDETRDSCAFLGGFCSENGECLPQ